MITQEKIAYSADDIKSMIKTCKKYKEALERAKGLLEGMKEGNYNALEDDIIDIFPELKESEDEKIKKTLIEYIKGIRSWNYFLGISKEQMIAWLEKQNKQSYSNIPSRETILAIWELGNDWKELTNGSISTEYGTQLEYIQNHWQESEYYLKENQDKQTQLDYEHADILQKDFAPIEPKFKVGDWVVNNVCFPIQIASIKDGMYIFTKGDAMSVLFIDGNYRLWTIQDAKDGDVLVCEDENFTIPFIAIYKCLGDTIYNKGLKDLTFNSHCFMGFNGNFYEGEDGHIIEGIHPAAKEQHNLLFRKMKEAGYEWNSEKKELKKIEVASKESKDEMIRQCLIEHIKGNKDLNWSLFQWFKPDTIIAWLEKQKKIKTEI